MAATEEGLRFLLLADVKDFERAQRDALTAADKAAKGIVQAGKMIAGSADYVKALQTQLKGFVSDLKSGETRFIAFGSAVDKNGKIFQNYTKNAGAAGGAVNSLSRIVQDAPFGFIAIQNNIAETVSQFGVLVNKSGGVANALKSVGASLLGPTGILLGINFLISGVTLLVQKYGSLSAAAEAILRPLSEQARLHKLVSDAQAQGQKDAQKELIQLDKLYHAATNLNVPLLERQKIVDALQKKFPAYFKDLNDEAILTGKAANEYKRLREEILALSVVKAIDKELENQAGSLVDLILKQKALQEDLESTRTAYQKLKKEFENDPENKRVARSFLVFSGLLENAENALESNRKEIEKVKKTQNELLNVQDDVIIKYGAAAAGVEESTDKNRTAADVLRELQKELAALNAQYKTVNFSLDSINGQKITALNKAFSDLVSMGVSPASKEIKDIISQINLLSASIQDITEKDFTGKRLFETEQIFSFDKKQIKDPSGLTTERLVLRLPIEVDREEILKGAKDASAKLQEGINFIQGGFVDASDHLRKQLNDTLNSSIAGGIGNIASAIGEALGTGDINNIFSAFANSIASFLEEMGKVLIAEGVAIEAFKASLESFQGVPAIIAGAALVVAGSAFRAFVGKGADSFATGGTIFEPSMVMAGDNVDGHKEHILSDLQLRKIASDAGVGGGNGRGYIAETRIELTELVIGLKRAGFAISRIN